MCDYIILENFRMNKYIYTFLNLAIIFYGNGFTVVVLKSQQICKAKKYFRFGKISILTCIDAV